MLTGSFSRANRKGALIAPAPGNNPLALGYVLSSLVTRKWQPGLRRTAPTLASRVKLANENGSRVQSSGSYQIYERGTVFRRVTNRSTNKSYALFSQLLLYTRHANDIHLLVFRQFDDGGDVHGRGIGRTINFILMEIL